MTAVTPGMVVAVEFQWFQEPLFSLQISILPVPKGCTLLQEPGGASRQVKLSSKIEEKKVQRLFFEWNESAMEVEQYCAEGHQLCSPANHRHSKSVSQTPQNP